MFKKLNEVEREGIISYLKERFGINHKVFGKFDFFIRGKKVWIATKGIDEKMPKARIEAVGMLFMRLEKGKMKLTTNAAQLFGKHAKKNVIELNDQQVYEALRGLDLNVDPKSAEDGYVLLKYKNDIIGVGQKRGDFIKNMIPKARRIKKF